MQGNFHAAQDQPRNMANATSFHIAKKPLVLRFVAKHRLLKGLQQSDITVETTATQRVTEIHRAQFVRVETLLVTPLNMTSQLQLKDRVRSQSDKTLNSKREKRGPMKATARCRSRNECRDFSHKLLCGIHSLAQAPAFAC